MSEYSPIDDICNSEGRKVAKLYEDELSQLRQLCREQHEALLVLHPKQAVWRTPTDDQAESIEKAIEKYTKVMDHE